MSSFQMDDFSSSISSFTRCNEVVSLDVFSFFSFYCAIMLSFQMDGFSSLTGCNDVVVSADVYSSFPRCNDAVVSLGGYSSFTRCNDVISPDDFFFH